MNVEEIRDYTLSLDGVQEAMPFGPDNLVFKIDGKMFLLLSLDSNPVQFNVKCDPEKAIQLREEFGSVLPGYHMSKKHWNTIL
ncbi:MAG: MmcQ/YjbR family DNA-binding protein, partial [Ginsengibacter sp.]